MLELICCFLSNRSSAFEYQYCNDDDDHDHDDCTLVEKMCRLGLEGESQRSPSPGYQARRQPKTNGDGGDDG